MLPQMNADARAAAVVFPLWPKGPTYSAQEWQLLNGIKMVSPTAMKASVFQLGQFGQPFIRMQIVFHSEISFLAANALPFRQFSNLVSRFALQTPVCDLLV